MLSVLLLFVGLLMLVPFFIEWKKVHKLSGEWKCNNDDKAVQMIVEDADRAKKRILVYGGNDHIYSNEKIIEAIINASNRGVVVEMIFEKESLSSARIIELTSKDDHIFLSFTNNKLFKHHFRVVDYDYVYLEKPHADGSQDHIYKRLVDTRFLPGDYSREFYRIRENAIC